jgi:hypothetical protein
MRSPGADFLSVESPDTLNIQRKGDFSIPYLGSFYGMKIVVYIDANNENR